MHNLLMSTFTCIKLYLWTWSSWFMYHVYCIYLQHSWICCSCLVPLYVQNKSCHITMDPKSSNSYYLWSMFKHPHWCASLWSKPTTTANLIPTCDCILHWKILLTPFQWSPISDCASNPTTCSFETWSIGFYPARNDEHAPCPASLTSLSPQKPISFLPDIAPWDLQHPTLTIVSFIPNLHKHDPLP